MSFIKKEHPSTIVDATNPEQPGAAVVTSEPTAGTAGVVVAPTVGYSDNPIRIDPTGTTVQPVSVVSGGGMNASVGPTGTPVPADATYFGGIDPNGDLTGLSIDADGNLKVNVTAVVAETVKIEDTAGNALTSTGGSLNVNVTNSPGSTVNQGSPNTATNSWPVEVTDGTNVLGTSSHPLRVDPTGTTTQNVAVTSALPAGTNVIGHVITDTGSTTAVTGTVTVDASGHTVPISAVSLPLPSGASTSAKQPALGTAGSASADVITVQGIASMTALKVDGSAVTQPVTEAGSTLGYGQVTVTNSATSIVAARAGRKALVITVLGSTALDVWVGDASVASSTGQLLVGYKGASISVPTASAVYGITASSNQTVSYLEIY